MSFCTIEELEQNKILKDIAHSRNRTLNDIFKYISRYDSIRERADEHRRKRLEEREDMLTRFEEELKEYEEYLSYKAMERILKGDDIYKIIEMIREDKVRNELENKLLSLKYGSKEIDFKDMEASLEDYEKQGYIDIENGEIQITSKGARALANYALEKILEKLAKKDLGSHNIEEAGYGPERSKRSRPYELGDKYELIDIERTLLNTLERGAITLSLKPKDFEVFETIHQSKICWGLIIDESFSMRWYNKFNAAIETALALAELIRREPKDSLKVFIFSEEVKQIQPWDLLRVKVPMRYTDIRLGMRTLREAISIEPGDKQAYLITDTEPNTENGRYVGFRRAVLGVLEEAAYYMQYGITLNIIMLDQNPYLREFASMLARRNLGRVLFTSPSSLGEVIIEDYLISKKRIYYNN